MPVIVIANPKGGTGKTTTTLVLGTTLAQQGASVAMLDCDKNQPLARWRKGASRTTAKVVEDVRDETIVTQIEQEAGSNQFVLVDLEGTPNRMTSRAFSRADLIVLPLQGMPEDAEMATKAIALVREEEQAFRRQIPYRVLLTRTNASVKPRLERIIAGEIRKANIPAFQTELNQRVAYPHMFLDRLTLWEMNGDTVTGLEAAQRNALTLAGELVDIIASLTVKDAAE